MNETKTPKWLLDTQNKSWEPEILISGITLTFLFILSTHIYNFYGMLIQDFAVWDVIAKNLYVISLIILTGLKIILIVHLILRGIWTGFIGLSYVFPGGVNKENVLPSIKNTHFDKPEVFVIKIEKICSLLFSFIFTSITFIIGSLIIFIPIVLLFFLGLDLSLVRIIGLAICFLVMLAAFILSILFQTKLKNSGFKAKLENSIFNNILATYMSNIGRAKTFLIFGFYFLLIILLSLSDITKFGFRNQKSAEISSLSNMVYLDKDHYDSLRDQKLRIERAAISEFRVTGDTLKLFIAFYKEDLFTLEHLPDDPSLCKEFGIKPDEPETSLADLYRISIDDKPIPGLDWYAVDHKYTNQKGIFTTIPINAVTQDGHWPAADKAAQRYHELRIDKIYRRISKKKMKLIKNWDIIPFKIAGKTDTPANDNIEEECK